MHEPPQFDALKRTEAFFYNGGAGRRQQVAQECKTQSSIRMLCISIECCAVVRACMFDCFLRFAYVLFRMTCGMGEGCGARTGF